MIEKWHTAGLPRDAEVLLTQRQVHDRIRRLGSRVTADYREKDLFVLSVLRGSVVFLADIIRNIHLPLEYHFVTITTYSGSRSPQRRPHAEWAHLPDLTGKHVLVVEDVLDSGHTLCYAKQQIEALGAIDCRVCVLFAKEGYEQSAFPNPDYIGFTVPRRYIVGYGLDEAQRWRNLPFVAVLPGREE